MHRLGATWERTVEGVMRRHWVAVTPLAPIRETLQLMRLARLRQLPVVAAGVLRGVVSYPALVDAALDGRASNVGQVMTPEMETGNTKMPVAEAAARVARSQVGCLPIVEPSAEGPRLVGLVTESDLLRLAYETGSAPARA
jgi:acetoin utilization protein AcuB